MRIWLARFSYSFIVVGALLLWQGQQISRGSGSDPGWRPLACYVGGLSGLALGVAGVRARHRDR